ncbi:nuclear transport factor 2 family protein [Alteromonas halophila]|nr:nuclear transport factor 2 family protein [Alteromonas halophila]
MKTLLSTLFLVISMISTCQASEKAVNEVLDSVHHSAAKANAEHYFSLFSADAVFIGTDASEVWTVSEFKDYAMPHFNKGTGWTYHPYNRHVYFSDDGDVAWFDELLRNDKLGITRGTGVLEKKEGNWKVMQYHLAIPVPNAIAGDVADQIKAIEKGGH